MNQANKNGREFREDMRAIMRLRGFEPERRVHRPAWATEGSSYFIDFAGDSGIAVECTFQRASGSADVKVFADIYSASVALDCRHYVIVLGGQHWESPRGMAIASAARDFAARESTDDKQLHVMTLWEFREWLKTP